MNFSLQNTNPSYYLFQPLSIELMSTIKRSMMGVHRAILRVSEEIILRRRRDATLSFKSDDSGNAEPVTSSDIAASLLLISEARRYFPHSESEEHLSPELPKNEPFWQIDPIDGTKLYDPNFPGYAATQFVEEIRGRKISINRQASDHGWGVMAALLEPTVEGGYLSRVAILHRPVLGESWLVGPDQVVKRYKEGRFEIISPRRESRGPVRAGIGTIYTPLEKEIEQLDSAFSDLGDLSLVDQGGAISYFTNFLEGKTDCFTFADGGIKSWDFAPGYALLTALGAKITEYRGQPIKNLFTADRRIRCGLRVSMPWINHR